ncbi:phage terminase small subunit P27 family [Methylophilus sp. Leaf414]|uniref:phage terminase small subunit P27 family n=1 Tax=Methylophilus sp. Leaf414 TaxID=1736371 RepID=UPI0006F227A5|nr:phage terminase small subunit P27 family [Methylophilus sp. Leaf414]KQT37690.1 hypothetical protein ASG24_01455 [Methylophilus sp. Leaf414]
MTGSRGPNSLPANVHALRGASKTPIANLTDSLQPEIEIPGCPNHLLKEARKEWKRITPELEKYGLISKLDRAALAAYCQSWALLVFVEEQLQRRMAIYEKKRLDAEARGEVYEGGDGLVEFTTNGNIIHSPYIAMRSRLIYTLQQALVNFGFTPAARGRVTPSTRLNRDMFDDQPDTGGGFANIG